MAGSVLKSIGHVLLCSAFCIAVAHPVMGMFGIEQAINSGYASLFNAAADPSVTAGADALFDPHAGHNHG